MKLYSWGTPNGRKVSIMLEELGLAYETIAIDISGGEQFAPDFLALNPNGKIPVLIDPVGPAGQPMALSESGAILIYLAEKSGRFLAAEGEARCRTLQWLMFQTASVGPMFGQLHHFRRTTPREDYGFDRYRTETHRLYRVLEDRLAAMPYLAGDDYSIADIATFPWIARHGWHEIDLATVPHVERWFARIGARPAVQRGMAVPFA